MDKDTKRVTAAISLLVAVVIGATLGLSPFWIFVIAVVVLLLATKR
jgi:hypothetical protein